MNRRRGLTMLEVLMALGLLASVVLAVLGMFPVVAQMSRNTMESSRQIYVAQEKMDELMRANQLVSTSYTVDYPLGVGYGYRRWRGLADPYVASAQQIEVEVAWVQDGRSRSILLYGLVSP